MQPSYYHLWIKTSSTFKPLFSMRASRKRGYSNIQRQKLAHEKPQHPTLQVSNTGPDQSHRCSQKPTRADLLDKDNYRTFPSFFEKPIAKASELWSTKTKQNENQVTKLQNNFHYLLIWINYSSLILSYLLLPDTTASFMIFTGSILRLTTHFWPDFFFKRKLASWAVFTYLKLISYFWLLSFV